MENNHVRLKRASANAFWRYEALVRVRNGSGGDPFILTVAKAGHEWIVESDDARPFPSLTQAREYVDRFFEEVKATPDDGRPLADESGHPY